MKAVSPMRPLRQIIDGPLANWMGEGEDWTAWLAFLSALRGEPMTRYERTLFRRHTGRTTVPTKPFNEAWVVAGRRARKSAIASVLAVYMAAYGKWPHAPGETLRVLVMAVNKEQAKIIRSYCEAILNSNEGLASLITKVDQDSIELSNGITIQCVPNSFRSVRGPTVVCAIFEEIAFWYDDRSSNPDTEVYRAVRPAMATVPGSLLLGISSPYARRGLLWQKYQRNWARDEARVLIWQASTEQMNPQVDPEVIAEAYETDPIAAAAEFGAAFRTDIESYVAREIVDALVAEGITERAPLSGAQYRAFVDPSGGANDSFTLAIAHMEKEVATLDCIREVRPPFSPEDTVMEFCALMKTYRISRVSGDRYAGEWPRERFKTHGIKYEVAEKAKSDIYRDCLPVFMSKKVSLLDDFKLINQLTGLERRTARGGRDSIDHAPGGKDDIANAVAGVLTALTTRKYAYRDSLDWVSQTPEERKASVPSRSVQAISGLMMRNGIF